MGYFRNIKMFIYKGCPLKNLTKFVDHILALQAPKKKTMIKSLKG